MVSTPTPPADVAPAPAIVSGLPERIAREMLGNDLVDAALAAQAKTGDASIAVRIGEMPEGLDHYPPGFVPGLVSIHRDGKPTVYNLGHAEALAQLAAITA